MPKSCPICKKSVPHLKKHYKKEHELEFKKRFIEGQNIEKPVVNRDFFWTVEEIRSFSTGEIIQKLHDFGVNLSIEEFLKDVNKFYSAEDLSNHWEEMYPIYAEGLDEDFIWMAAMVLWERLAPEIMNSERIDDLMQEGYDYMEIGESIKACDIWFEVWDILKKRFTLDMRSIEETRHIFSGSQSLYNWSQDFATELGNAGLKDGTFYQKRIDYCREFCVLFPESDPRVLCGMLMDEAESYFAVNRVEEGEEAFKRVTQTYPDNTWGYIKWGDMYYLLPMNKQSPIDIEKAERIYRMALDKVVEEKDVVLERLKDLEEDKCRKRAP